MKNDPTNDKERIKADILKEYPYLKVADGKTTSWALAAKNIRLLLKKNFPDTRFTVRSSSFAGGSSVCVSWKMTDWSEDAEEDFSENPSSLEPVENQVKKSRTTVPDVDALISIFKYGKFNASEDIYEYDTNNYSSIFHELFGSTRFTQAYAQPMTKKEKAQAVLSRLESTVEASSPRRRQRM